MSISDNHDGGSQHLVIADGHWSEIVQLLGKGQGREVRNILQRVRRDDVKAFNCLYWRVQLWMEGYLARRPISEEEEKLQLTKRDVGQFRFSKATNEMLGGLGGRAWQTEDLPAVLAKIIHQ